MSQIASGLEADHILIGTGKEKWHEHDHPAIIPKDIFMQVQEELVRRRVVQKSPMSRSKP